MQLNIILGSRSSEAEIYTTLAAPSGTVATLNRVAEMAGEECVGFDETFPGPGEIREEIFTTIDRALKDGETVNVCFSALSYNAENTLGLIDEVKSIFGKNANTILGGQLVPYARNAYIKNPNIDTVTIGDGEVLVPKIIEYSRNSQGLPLELEGWLAPDNTVFSGVSYANFWKIKERLASQKEVMGWSQLVTQGLGGPGCSWAAGNKNGACTFCALQNIQVMNNLSFSEYFKLERHLQDTYNPDRFFDIANQFIPVLGRKATIEWLHKYIEERNKHGVTIDKYAYLTVGSIDMQVASLLKEAGITQVYLGIDHFSPTALVGQNKSFRRQEQLSLCLEALRKNGISYRAGIVLGAVPESKKTLEDVETGVKWLLTNYGEGLESLGIFPVLILPGSKIYEKARKDPKMHKIIKSFEGKGYFTLEEEADLTRRFTELNSSVSTSDIGEIISNIETMIKSTPGVIGYDYNKSPGSEIYL